MTKKIRRICIRCNVFYLEESDNRRSGGKKLHKTGIRRIKLQRLQQSSPMSWQNFFSTVPCREGKGREGKRVKDEERGLRLDWKYAVIFPVVGSNGFRIFLPLLHELFMIHSKSIQESCHLFWEPKKCLYPDCLTFICIVGGAEFTPLWQQTSRLTPLPQATPETYLGDVYWFQRQQK